MKLFFVLSGYLIVSILAKQRVTIEAGGSSGWAELGEFWKRRALRIFPIYFLTLSALSLAIAAGYLVPQGITYYWYFLGNYYLHWNAITTGAYHWGQFGHLWSVAVENQFYAVAGFALLFTGRRWHVPVLTVLLCASLASITPLLGEQSFDDVLPLPNFSFLAAGGLIPLWWQARNRPNTLWLAVVACIALFALKPLQSKLGVPHIADRSITFMLELAFSWSLIAHVAKYQAGYVTTALEWGPLQRLGTISYGFYVYHLFSPQLITLTVMLGLNEPSHVRNLIWMPVQFAMTVFVSAISWHFIENPLLRLKRKRFETLA